MKKLTKLSGDISERKYYRIKERGKSYIECRYPTKGKETLKDFLSIRDVLEENGVRVPKIYGYDLALRSIRQEDLGDTALLRRLGKIKDATEEYEIYKKIIDTLVKIHSINPILYEDQNFTQRSLTKEKLMGEVEMASQYFLQNILSANPQKIRHLTVLFSPLCHVLAKGKKVIIHRDFHSKNIMVKKGHIIIDFQDAMMGLPQYDLCSLIDDCYYEILPSNKERLKRYYWRKFLYKKERFDDFLYLYDLSLVQRSFKAVGSFSYFFHKRKDTRYLRQIGLAFERIRVVLLKYGRFKMLRKTLSELYYD